MYIIYQVPHQSPARAFSAHDTADLLGWLQEAADRFDEANFPEVDEIDDDADLMDFCLRPENLTDEIIQELAVYDMHSAYVFKSLEEAQAALKDLGQFNHHALQGIEALEIEVEFHSRLREE